ncbi:MAG TPA: ABC transporter substrate-binding protein, partial [Candidatus Dormibacteraeota bacterium]|nr:ABC transporter substrate-binding protein [Candidatus Dormibacteraeota bacterium]
MATRAQARRPTLVIGFPSTPETIDPHQFRSVLSGSIIGLMGEGLMTRDPQTMEIKPLLAESWKNLNPNTWEIKLRRGVKFHNGEDFTAESVKFTVERAIGSKLNTLGKLTWPPSFGQDVHIVDPYTVRIVSQVPDPMVPSRLAAESMNIAPAKGLSEFRDKFVTDRFIGTGPFRFVEHVVGDRVVMEANPTYWGPKPPTQKIVWQVIPDSATRLAALQRGDVDVMLNLPFPLAPTVEADPNLRVYSELSSLTHGILFNARESAPLRDRRVRQALNMAVDRAAILKGLYSGRGQFLNTVTGKNVANTIDPGAYPYDPARAKALLAEAGFGAGFELTMWQSIGRWVLAEETAQVIAGYWDKVGVKTKVQVLEWAEFNKRSAASTHRDCFYYAFINGTWDASYTVQRFKPDFQTFRYFDASGDLLKTITEYERTFDPRRRRELGAQALRGLHEEAVWLFLWQLDELFGVSRKVKGFKMRPDNLLWVRDTYVEA